VAKIRFAISARRKGEPYHLPGMSYREEDYDSIEELKEAIGVYIDAILLEEAEYEYRNEGNDED